MFNNVHYIFPFSDWVKLGSCWIACLVGRPAGFAQTVSLSSLEPAMSESSTFLPSVVKPQAASTGSHRCAGRMRSAIPSTKR